MIRALIAIATFVATTTAHASPGPAPELFVLIVTNNRSIELGRPDLSYADDDGAKYYEVFRTVAPEAHVHLLTELDRDTARLFPTLAPVIQPPTKQAVWSAVATIADQVAELRRAGRTAELTFIFAGHGDVDGGRGFLELADGRFTSDDLELMLRKVNASRSHVILDSCNSFFVIDACKPGGRRFATPTDAADSLRKRFPTVGVFLSTSAEAEVFEWSELQSGIFSHAVRSGLMGAADANGDGVVSYEELAAFVDTSTSAVKNPSFRPKVYARGPDGNADATLFSPGQLHARNLPLDSTRSMRVTVRDVDDLPWIHSFRQAGAPMVLHLPEGLDRGTLEELAVDPSGAHVIARHTIEVAPETQTVALADTVPAADRAPRGANELFRMLFTRPFGPQAVATYRVAEASVPPPVYGISQEDSVRMNLLLSQVGDIEHGNRMIGGYGLAGVGGLAIAGGAFALEIRAADGSRSPPALGWTMVGLGVAAIVAGGITLARRSPAEKLRQRLADGLASGDPGAAIADADRRLREIAGEYRRARMWLRYCGIGSMALAAVGLAVGEGLAHHDRAFDPTITRIDSAGFFLGGGALVLVSQYKYPVERMAELWDADPGIHHMPRLSVAPISHGFVLGLTGEL